MVAGEGEYSWYLRDLVLNGLGRGLDSLGKAHTFNPTQPSKGASVPVSEREGRCEQTKGEGKWPR